MNSELIEKSKEISYALRHKPEKYGLKLDSTGSVLVDTFIHAINNKHGNQYLSIDDIHAIIRQSDKKRFEIDGNMIRAMYGHSCNTEIKYDCKIPPAVLYHGTTHQAYEQHIGKEGLKPMNRQYVHLSESIDTANIVGARRDKNPVILQIDAAKMTEDGIKFYAGNDKVWLCDSVDIRYIIRIR